LVEPTTRGDPESPLRWTCKSVRRLAQALQAQGHQVSRTLVAELLNAAGYSLQANRKTKEGDNHPDRDAQFGYINTQVTTALTEQQPIPQRHCRLGRRDGRNQYQTRRIPRRVELHYLAECLLQDCAFIS
jgi:elongation factor P hydroxylase